ncbi:MAG: ROK family protein [Candidatus Aenigmarchaeota archaeon]|nr:ROK family protein [Candidatus Aenigmarchaeota archaeon]
MECWMGIDIGGSHVEGVLITSRLGIIKQVREDILKRDRKNFLKTLDDTIKELNDKGVKGIGFGVPGPVKNGVMFWSCNSTFLEGIDFSKIGMAVSKNVSVDNDVNAMAFGEAFARKKGNLLAVTLGTGVGGGIVIDGKPYNQRSFAGEVGHMSIDPTGIKCTCGSRGCWQEYVGSRGVERLAFKHLGRKMSPADAYDLAARGDGKAKKLWEEYGCFMGVGLANLCNVLDPEVIVIGGGISGAFQFFEKSMKKEMKKRLRMDIPVIEKAGESAVAFGAACMAKS